MWLQAGGRWNLLLAVFLVLCQRGAQLCQLLVLAWWGDTAMRSKDCDHKGFAILLLAVLGANATCLVASEWACSRVAVAASKAIHERLLDAFLRTPWSGPNHAWAEVFSCELGCLDSVMLSSLLSGLRSALGTLLQQAYILSIAPQWLSCIVLLPLYACVCYFSFVYLRSNLAMARAGRRFLADGRATMDETLADPVCVRANGLTPRVTARVAAAMKASAAFANMLPAASRCWVCFRVALCLGFAASACALHVLLADGARQVGVGTLGLVVSLLFAFLGDFEVASEICAQAAVAISALDRVSKLTGGLEKAPHPAAAAGQGLAAQLELSPEEMPHVLSKSGGGLSDTSGLLLELNPSSGTLEPADGRTLADLAASIKHFEDYCIISVNRAAFDAEAMAEELVGACSGKACSSASQISLTLRHRSVLQGLSVSFQNVTASSRGGSPALQNASFEVARGAHVGILGPPGSGQSTLLAAATGLLECSGVRLEGRPANASMGLIGLITQEPVVWEGSLRENLDPEDRFTDEAVREALQGVGLGDFVLAKGLHAQLAKEGENLSLGQRQLLSLARVALKRPPLLLLDECAALLTPAACQTVKAALEGPFRDATVVAAISSEATAGLLGLKRIIQLRKGSAT